MPAGLRARMGEAHGLPRRALPSRDRPPDFATRDAEAARTAALAAASAAAAPVAAEPTAASAAAPAAAPAAALELAPPEGAPGARAAQALLLTALAAGAAGASLDRAAAQQQRLIGANLEQGLRRAKSTSAGSNEASFLQWRRAD